MTLLAEKRRGGIAPAASIAFVSLVQALRAPFAWLKPSGRSQRGDSAWNKTLDHLLSLLAEIPI